MVTVSNKEIYNAVQELKIHVIRTNGKVKLNRWIGTTALAIGMSIVLNMALVSSGIL